VGTSARGVADALADAGVRFLLDENIPAAFAEALRLVGYNTVSNKEVNLKGAIDPAVIEFCGDKGLVWVTRDIEARKKGAYVGLVQERRVSAVFHPLAAGQALDDEGAVRGDRQTPSDPGRSIRAGERSALLHLPGEGSARRGEFVRGSTRALGQHQRRHGSSSSPWTSETPEAAIAATRRPPRGPARRCGSPADVPAAGPVPTGPRSCR
jgi:hypothetical protein